MKDIRRIEQLRRRAGRRQPFKMVLIVCEGERTEPLYFRSMKTDLRANHIMVEVEGSRGRSAPLQVVERAIQSKKKRLAQAKQSIIKEPFNEVWCVLDVEAGERERHLPEALNLARRHQIRIALSNPCFEVWYLLHYRSGIGPYMSCNNVIAEIYKLFPDYQKRTNLYLEIKQATHEAIKSSRKILENHPEGSSLIPPNASTQVHVLVERLIQFPPWMEN